MQPVTDFEIDRTEVTIGEFRAFVKATGYRTRAEREGGGFVFDGGWQRRPGWHWAAPYGYRADDREPVVHVDFAEAAAFCRWAGKRLPSDAEWVEAAHVEHRSDPPPPFVTGGRYPYPTGTSPVGANCLDECGATRTVAAAARLPRGHGHALAGTTRAGVNGLFDMGANVWEWVDSDVPGGKRTRGGSWWYGASQMHLSHSAAKPPDFPAVYIGFRCVR